MTPSKGNSSLSHHSHEKHRSNYGRVDDSLIWSQFGLPSDKPKLPSRRPGAHRPADDSTSNRNSVLRTEVEGTEFDYLSWVPHSWVVFFFSQVYCILSLAGKRPLGVPNPSAKSVSAAFPDLGTPTDAPARFRTVCLSTTHGVFGGVRRWMPSTSSKHPPK